MKNESSQGLARSKRIKAKLPNGEAILIEVENLMSESKVSAGVAFDFATVSKQIDGIAAALLPSLEAASPKEIEVEFGIEVVAEPGSLTALLVKGSGTASLNVRMTWKK